MKLTKYFLTEKEIHAFAEGLRQANTGHLHTMRQGPTESGFFVQWHDESRKPSDLPEKPPPLTPAEYVERKGNLCPVCRGKDRTGHEVEYDHGDKLVTRGVSCNNPDCEASWLECYELSGYDNLER